MCRDHRMDTPKLTTVLHFGQWPHQKVNTVSQFEVRTSNFMVQTREQDARERKAETTVLQFWKTRFCNLANWMRHSESFTLQFAN